MFTITIQNGVIFYKFFECLAIKYAGLFSALGFVSTLCLTVFSGVPTRLFRNSDEVFDLSSIILISGILGARVFYVATHLAMFNNLWQMLDLFDGGMTLSGTILVASSTTAIYCWIRYGRILEYLDFVAPLAAFAQIFMRLGCFFGGCCYGKVVGQGFWLPRVLYTNQLSLAPTGQLLAASQLYSAFLSLVLFVVLWRMFNQPHRPGKIIGWYFIAESGSRFVVDWSRGSREFAVLGLTWAQIFAIIFTVLGILILSIKTSKPSESFPINKKQS